MTTLHDFIVTSNDIKILRKLLKEGEDPNTQFTIDGSARTPLHFAIFKCEKKPQEVDDILQVARELINFGANVNLADNGGQTPLHLAVRSWNYKMVDLLLQANAHIDKKDGNGYAALHYAAARFQFSNIYDYYDHLRVVNLLLKYNPKVDIRGQKDETPLMFAVRIKNLRVVNELLNKQASVYLIDSRGKSAMHYALLRSNVDLNIALKLFEHVYFISDEIIISFICRLPNASRKEIEKAKYILKFFVLHSHYFNNQQLRRIIETCKEENTEISRLLELCNSEIHEMISDELAPGYSLYSVSVHFILFNFLQKHFLYEAVDKAIDKLLGSQYPFYCNLVVSNIASPYINEKLAVICCNTEKTGKKFLNYDTLYFLSFYLSKYDMFNMMLAFSGQ